MKGWIKQKKVKSFNVLCFFYVWEFRCTNYTLNLRHLRNQYLLEIRHNSERFSISLTITGNRQCLFFFITLKKMSPTACHSSYHVLHNILNIAIIRWVDRWIKEGSMQIPFLPGSRYHATSTMKSCFLKTSNRFA